MIISAFLLLLHLDFFLGGGGVPLQDTFNQYEQYEKKFIGTGTIRKVWIACSMVCACMFGLSWVRGKTLCLG